MDHKKDYYGYHIVVSDWVIYSIIWAIREKEVIQSFICFDYTTTISDMKVINLQAVIGDPFKPE